MWKSIEIPKKLINIFFIFTIAAIRGHWLRVIQRFRIILYSVMYHGVCVYSNLLCGKSSREKRYTKAAEKATKWAGKVTFHFTYCLHSHKCARKVRRRKKRLRKRKLFLLYGLLPSRPSFLLPPPERLMKSNKLKMREKIAESWASVCSFLSSSWWNFSLSLLLQHQQLWWSNEFLKSNISWNEKLSFNPHPVNDEALSEIQPFGNWQIKVNEVGWTQFIKFFKFKSQILISS